MTRPYRRAMGLQQLSRASTGAVAGIALGFVFGLLTANPVLGLAVGAAAAAVFATVSARPAAAAQPVDDDDEN